MKTFFLLTFLAIAAITGAATAQQQCHQGQLMDACRDYLKQQCTASAMPITWPWKWRMGSCRALRQRCCGQLERVPPTCRCQAICTTVQEIQGAGLPGSSHQATMGKVRQMAKILPSTCNMYPSYCNIPATGGCYYY